MEKGKKIIIIAIGVVIFVTICLGYFISDDRYYSTVIAKNNLKTPYDVFKWTTHKFSTVSYMYNHTYASPRHLIEQHKGLWCDEGAIVMATLNHKLGYKTRLVDLYDYNNIPHHTILQVYEKGKWVNYDFVFRLHNLVLTRSSDSFKLKEVRTKKYPKLYNFIVNNNYFAKKIIFKLRGISDTEPNIL